MKLLLFLFFQLDYFQFQFLCKGDLRVSCYRNYGKVLYTDHFKSLILFHFFFKYHPFALISIFVNLNLNCFVYYSVKRIQDEKNEDITL